MKSNFRISGAAATSLLLGAGVFLSGCSGRATVLPNPDPALHKTSTEFAVDAVRRFPYQDHIPQGGDIVGRAQVGYMVKKIELVNLSADDWNNIEVWLNQKYVVFVPKMTPHILEELPFQMFYDDQGHYFPKDGSDGNASLVKKLEIVMDGKMYNVPLQLAD